MELCKAVQLIKRIDLLIRLNATGTPQSFADKLGVSERTMYYYIDEMKTLGLPIAFNKCLQSYEYTEPGGLMLIFKP
jgi:predicted DNA-binding transcriptional regulator YafY